MTPWHVSECGRFVVIDALHLDRTVVETLALWASNRALGIQDAIQLALCSFNERNAERRGVGEPSETVFRVQDSCVPVHVGPSVPLNSVPSEGEHERRVRLLGVPHGGDSDERPFSLGR